MLYIVHWYNIEIRVPKINWADLQYISLLVTIKGLKIIITASDF